MILATGRRAEAAEPARRALAGLSRLGMPLDTGEARRTSCRAICANLSSGREPSLAARFDLLDGPLAAVRVAEEDERPPLAAGAGLTTGAVTGVVDRLERAGYARRVPDPADRRKVNVEVTDRFYDRAGEIWGPVAADWQALLARRFTSAEVDLITEFLRASNELSRRHLERISAAS